MGLAHSPRIVTNGLLLCLDASNAKSLKGVGPNRLGTIFPSFNNWNGLVGTSTSYTGANGQPGVYLNVTTGGGVNWWNSSNGATACSGNTTYMISALVKWEGGTPHPNLFYVRQYNSSGTQTSESGKFNTNNTQALGNGFYFVWAFFVTDATAATFLVQGYEYNVRKIWLENVVSKRAGLDDVISGQYPAYMSGVMNWSPANGGVLVYSSGNSLAVNNINLASSAYTVMSAARYNGSTRGRIVNSINNNWLIGHWGTTTENYYAEGWVSTSSAGASDTLWRVHAATGNPTTDSWQLYVNGNSSAGPNVSGSAGPNGIGIGTHSEYSDAVISFVYVYNRVLSAEEVQQNFNAVRSRYSI